MILPCQQLLHVRPPCPKAPHVECAAHHFAHVILVAGSMGILRPARVLLTCRLRLLGLLGNLALAVACACATALLRIAAGGPLCLVPFQVCSNITGMFLFISPPGHCPAFGLRLSSFAPAEGESGCGHWVLPGLGRLAGLGRLGRYSVLCQLPVWLAWAGLGC